MRGLKWENLFLLDRNLINEILLVRRTISCRTESTNLFNQRETNE